MLRNKTNRSNSVTVMLLAFVLYVMAQGMSFAQTSASTDVQGAVTADATEEEKAKKIRRALKLLRPQLRFDSGEDFFPLRADVITNNVGNRLARDTNQTIAERLPGGKELRIGYLHGGDKYPNGQDILNNDKIIERHESKDDYFRDAAKLQADIRYRDRMHGRVILIKDGGRITGAWLQYWLFYYYNDFPYGPTGGDHEGDWELVQIKLDPNAIPVYAVYSHHGKGSKCTWTKVEKEGSRPVVYVALGSHANYFRAGAHGQDFSNDGEKRRGMSKKWFITIGSNSPRWLNWPGFWGGTKAEGPFGADSPQGPKMQKKMWDPEIFAGEAEADDDCND